MARETLIIRIKADGTRVVKREITDVGSAAKRSGDGVKILKNALTAVAGAAVIRQTIRLSDTYINLQNRLRVVTSGTENLTEVTQALQRISVDTRSSLASNAELFSRLAISAKELGVNQQDLLQFTDSLNKAIKLSGASAVEANAGLIQLSQGIASGALRGDELRSVLEQLPVVADVIAKRLGVTRGQLRQLGADGKITAGIILDAFKDAREELDDNFGKTLPTTAEGFVVLGNAIVELVGVLNEATGAGEGLVRILISTSEAIVTISENVRRSGIQGLGEAFFGEFQELAAVEDQVGRINRLLLEQQRRRQEGQSERDALRGITEEVGPPAPSAADIALRQKQEEVIGRINQRLEQENELLQLQGFQREVQQQLFAAENQLRRAKVDLSSEEGQQILSGIEAQVRENQALSDRVELLNDILGPERERIQQIADVNDLVREGLITQEQASEFLKEQASAVDQLVQELSEEVELLQLSTLAAERRAIALQAEQALLEEGVSLESRRAQQVLSGIEASAQELQLLREKQAVLSSLRIEEDQQVLRAQAINELRAEGLISQAEANRLLSDLADQAIAADDALGGLASSLQRVDTSARSVGESIGQAFVQSVGQASNAIAEFVVEGAKGIDDLRQQISNILKNLAKQIIATIVQALILRALVGKGGGGGGGGLLGLLGLGVQQRQAGGPVQRGRPVVVGERGPELFVPPSNGNVAPNSQTQQQPAQMGVTVINVSDQNEIPAALQSRPGEEALLNVISKNARQVSQIINQGT